MMREASWEGSLMLCNSNYSIIISNKARIKPASKVSAKRWDERLGWGSGYPFDQFLCDVYFYLDDLAELEDMQQLIHQYYLQNGKLDAITTAKRILKLIGENKSTSESPAQSAKEQAE